MSDVIVDQKSRVSVWAKIGKFADVHKHEIITGLVCAAIACVVALITPTLFGLHGAYKLIIAASVGSVLGVGFAYLIERIVHCRNNRLQMQREQKKREQKEQAERIRGKEVERRKQKQDIEHLQDALKKQYDQTLSDFKTSFSAFESEMRKVLVQIQQLCQRIKDFIEQAKKLHKQGRKEDAIALLKGVVAAFKEVKNIQRKSILDRWGDLSSTHNRLEETRCVQVGPNIRRGMIVVEPLVDKGRKEFAKENSDLVAQFADMEASLTESKNLISRTEREISPFMDFVSKTEALVELEGAIFPLT